MKKGETALLLAAKEGKKEMIDSLVNFNADIAARDRVRMEIACLTYVVLIKSSFSPQLCVIVCKRGNPFLRVAKGTST